MIQFKNNRLLKNMTTYAILQVVNLLVGLLLPRLYLSVYGSEVNGIVSTINSFTTYFTYLEAGLGLTLIHSLFKPLADGDSKSINNILSYSKQQYKKISLIYSAIVILLSVVFPLIRSSNELNRPEFALLVFVIGIYGAIDFYTMAKYRVLLTADRKEYVISNSMIIAQLMRFIFVWLLLQFELSIVLVKTVPILTLLIRSLILKLYVKKYYPNANYSEKCTVKVTGAEQRWDALLLQISISTSTALPAIIISQILGFKEANVYAVYGLVINAVISIVSALSSGVSPMLGKSISENRNIEKTYSIYSKIVTLTIRIVFSVTAVMTIPFIKIYTSVVDDVNYIRPLYALLSALFGALYTYRIPLTAVTNAAAIYRENRANNIINLVIQVIGCSIAAYFWGIPGVLIVLAISSIQRNICLFISNKKTIKTFSLYQMIFDQAGLIIGIVLSYYLASGFIENKISGFISWCVYAFAVFLVISLVNISITAAFNYKKIKVFTKNLKSKKY